MATLERSPEVAALAASDRGCPLVGHPQIRNRGTVGGSVAHADPAAELPAALVALRRDVPARSARGTRELAVEDLFVTHLTTALEPDELLVAIEVPPLPAGTGGAFVEHARVHGDFALGGAAVVAGADRASVVLLAAGPKPLRAVAVEEALADGADPTEAAELAGDVVDTSRGGYRRALVTELTRRALTLALERAA